MAFRDVVSIWAGVYANCQLNTLLNTIGGLFSQEGITTFFTRFFSSILFEIPDNIIEYRDTSNTFDKAKALAKIFSILLNFKI